MEKTKHIFNYIFYMAYIRDEKRWNGSPLLSGILRVCLVVSIYIFIISFILDVLGFNIFEKRNNIVPESIVASIIIFIINYFIYGYKKKYLKIIKKYRKEDNEARKKNRKEATVFIVLSLIFFAVMFIVSVQLH